MKNYAEIMKEIEKTEKKIKDTKSLINELCKTYAIKRENEKEISAASEKLTKLVLTKNYLLDNAQYVFAEEYAPVIIEVLKKYNGKPYGEKTETKIRQEIKGRYNISFYISKNYSTCDLTIYYLNKDGYRVAGHDTEVKLHGIYGKDQLLTEENKINVNAEIRNDYKYIENIPQAVNKIIKAKKQAYKAIKEAERITSEYNALLPGKLNAPCYINITTKNNYRECFDFSIR